MINFHIIMPCVALVGVSACGGTTSDTPFVLPDDYLPFLTEADVESRLDDIAEYEALAATPSLAILPTGSATYSGAARVSLDVDDDGFTDHILIGDAAITAELLFAGDDLSGSIFNVHLINGTTPTENVEGSLTLTGTLDDGNKQVSGTVIGDLTGYLDSETLQSFSLVGSFAGETRDRVGIRTSPFLPPPTERADAITADMTGQLGGDLAGGDFFGSFAASR